jgi:hypothetical protein
MNKGGAYSLLAGELNEYRNAGYHAALELVDAPPRTREDRLEGELIVIETRVTWENERRQTLRVEATAYGPNCFHLERLGEAMILGPE